MEITNSISGLKNGLSKYRFAGKSIALVPTMGALHEGHLQLVKEAADSVDIVAASIFVNPIQFNNRFDLENYPRTFEQDAEMLEKSGCTLLFAPPVHEMYPLGEPRTRLDFGALEKVLEGSFRPGHFNGVGMVVSRLFHLFQPDKSFFGQKDLQQCYVVKQLVVDLGFPVEIRIVPTVREPDGLAMSSRNKRLTREQREQAFALFRVLTFFKEQLLSGSISAVDAKENALSLLKDFPLIRVEYLSLVELSHFSPTDIMETGKSYAACIAAYAGEVRLIDNVFI